MKLNGRIEIKEIGVDFLEELAEVGKQTFFETFQEFNSKEDMKLYLQKHFNKSSLIKELQTKSSFFYLCFFNGEVSGYLKLNTGSAQTESFDESHLEIERLYILENFQWRGLGKTLIEKSFEEAQKKGKSKVWLGVWENNEKALEFYKKLGFKEFGRHIFMLGKDEQTDILVKKEI